MNKTYTVAYGEEVKIVTHPKGNCTGSWDNGAPTAEANDRCRTAINQTIEYFNEWTGIKGFTLQGTGIESLNGDEQETVIYDLGGRRVQKAQKGIYIINGKKVLK